MDILKLAREATKPLENINYDKYVWTMGEDDLQRFADLVLEEAAGRAWSHYMDACKNRRVSAAENEHWLSSPAIRAMKGAK